MNVNMLAGRGTAYADVFINKAHKDLGASLKDYGIHEGKERRLENAELDLEENEYICEVLEWV